MAHTGIHTYFFETVNSSWNRGAGVVVVTVCWKEISCYNNNEPGGATRNGVNMRDSCNSVVQSCVVI